MTLTELRYIVAVAEERHFGRAAQRCHVSQPTLSIAIKKLEEELAVSLFDRSGSEVMATHVGQRIVAQSQKVIDAANVIYTLASKAQDELDGALKFGANFYGCALFIAKIDFVFA